MLPRAWTLLAAAALSSACTVQTVAKRAPRRGPVPEVGYVDNGNGELRYSTEGWGWVIAMRRRTALSRMRSICKGMKFKIDDEFTQNDMEVAYSESALDSNLGHGLNHYNVNPFHHMIFECIPEVPASK